MLLHQFKDGITKIIISSDPTDMECDNTTIGHAAFVSNSVPMVSISMM